MRAAKVRAVRSVHERSVYEGAFAQLFADLQDARAAAAAAQHEAHQLRRQSQPAGPPAGGQLPLLLHDTQFEQPRIALGGGVPVGSQAAAAGPPPPLQGVHQSRAGASEIMPAAVETTSSLGGDGRRGGSNMSDPRLPNASSPQPGPSTELQRQGRATVADHSAPDSWAASPLDYASAARAAAMATPQHLPQQHTPQYTPQYTSLPGLPSSSSPVAGGSARRRGWLGWVFGAGGQDRPPKKRVRNALI